jgi:hypothetical protein
MKKPMPTGTPVIGPDGKVTTPWIIYFDSLVGSGSSGGGGVPDGGAEGAALVKASGTNQDLAWDNLEFSGFSERFGEAFDSAGLNDTLAKILELGYAAPLISLSGSSNSVREKGATVSSITLTATITRRSDPIARIQFFRGVTSIADFNPPANTGSGTQNATYSTPFSDTTSFTAQVRDNGASGGPTTVTSNTVTYNFVYPYYFGAALPGRTAVQVAALTKDIRVSTASLNKVFTTSAGDVFYFAYPASYGALTSILDENGFETFGDWTLRIENITGLDSNPVSYRIYEFNNPVVAFTTNYTFIR